MTNSYTPTQWAKAGTWNGTRDDEDDDLTVEQRQTMNRQFTHRGRWDYRTVKVKAPREPTLRERQMGKPRHECFDEAVVICPIVSRGLETDQVIAPGGDIVLVKSEAAKRKRKA